MALNAPCRIHFGIDKERRKEVPAMKRTAKLLAVLLAVLLGMTVVAPMFVNADFTALPPETFSLTMHKYLMEDLSLAGNPNDGNIVAPGDLPASAEALPGVVFKLYKLDLPTTTEQDPYDGVDNPNADNAPWDNTAWAELIKDFNNISFILDDYDNPTKIFLSDTLTYKGPTGASSYIQIDNFDLVKVGAVAESWTMPATDATGAATINSGATGALGTALTKGFYVVVEQLGTNPEDNSKIASISYPFVISLPMTATTGADAGKAWLDDIHAYPKNGDITITKDVDRTSVKLGEEVEWEVIVSVPADIMHYRSFFMTDALDEALTYVAGSLEVYAMDDAAGTNEFQIVNPGSGIPYYLETVAPAVAADTAADPHNLNDGAQTLRVDFITRTREATNPPGSPTYTVDGRTQLFGDFNKDGEVKPADSEFVVKFVKFVFKTYVNDKILDRDEQAATPPPEADHQSYTVYNDAYIRFKNRFDRDSDKPRWRRSNRKEIHTSAIVFLKEDAHTNLPLAGAKFQIASSEANARAGLFLKRILKSVNVSTTSTPIYENVWSIIDVGETVFTYDVNFNGIIDAGETTRTSVAYAAVTGEWVEESKTYNNTLPVGDPYYLGKDSFSGAENWWAKANGKAVVRFEGLKEYVGNYDFLSDTGPRTYLPSYWVVEVFAPTVNGVSYNLLMEPVELTFSATTSTKLDDGTVLGWYTLDGGVVRNTNTFTLPRTGGIGTILFTAGGIALIGVAVVLLIVGAKKKKASNAA